MIALTGSVESFRSGQPQRIEAAGIAAGSDACLQLRCRRPTRFRGSFRSSRLQGPARRPRRPPQPRIIRFPTRYTGLRPERPPLLGASQVPGRSGQGRDEPDRAGAETPKPRSAWSRVRPRLSRLAASSAGSSSPTRRSPTSSSSPISRISQVNSGRLLNIYGQDVRNDEPDDLGSDQPAGLVPGPGLARYQGPRVADSPGVSRGRDQGPPGRDRRSSWTGSRPTPRRWPTSSSSSP